MAIGRGLVPGTSCATRRKLAKTHTPVSVGEDQGVDAEVEDVGWGATPVPHGSSDEKRRGARTRSRAFVARHMPDVDGPRVNATVLAALLVVGLAVWGALDVAQRESKPPLEPGEPPHSTASWIGWGTALGGTALYSTSSRSFSTRACAGAALMVPARNRLSSARPDPQDRARQGPRARERVDVRLAPCAELHDARRASPSRRLPPVPSLASLTLVLRARSRS